MLLCANELNLHIKKIFIQKIEFLKKHLSFDQIVPYQIFCITTFYFIHILINIRSLLFMLTSKQNLPPQMLDDSGLKKKYCKMLVNHANSKGKYQRGFKTQKNPYSTIFFRIELNHRQTLIQSNSTKIVIFQNSFIHHENFFSSEQFCYQ